MTKNELIAQFKAENPKVVSIINGEEIELTAAEYEANAQAWATMRLEQIQLEQTIAEGAAAKAALLERLGITEDEAKLLLS